MAQVKMTSYRIPFEVGHKLTGKIVKQEGVCHWGHKVGQEFEVNIHNTGGLCGFFYNALYPTISMLQFGANMPKGWFPNPEDTNTMLVVCTDWMNPVTMELRRSGPNRPPTMLEVPRETSYRVPFEVGHTLTGKIIKQENVCHWGHEVGQEFEVNIHNTGGLCGFFYSALYPTISMLQFGADMPEGWFPNPNDTNIMHVVCTDWMNPVTMELCRSGLNRPPTMLE
jgi:uncharacterized repeat protein (TIGR04076 family)